LWPGLIQQFSAGAQLAPQRFAGVRDDWRQQDHCGFQHFLRHRAAHVAAQIGFAVVVEQFHAGGDRGVELFAAAIVVGDFLDSAVQLEAQGFLCRVQFAAVYLATTPALTWS
jgi:hypothetical protein